MRECGRARFIEREQALDTCAQALGEKQDRAVALARRKAAHIFDVGYKLRGVTFLDAIERLFYRGAALQPGFERGRVRA